VRNLAVVVLVAACSAGGQNPAGGGVPFTPVPDVAEVVEHDARLFDARPSIDAPAAADAPVADAPVPDAPVAAADAGPLEDAALLDDGAPAIDSPIDAPVDAVEIDAPVGPVITGRFCQIHDLSTLQFPCAQRSDWPLPIVIFQTGVGAMATSNGEFTLASPGPLQKVTLKVTGNTTWYATAIDVTTGADGNATLTIPVISIDDLNAIAATNLVTIPSGTGVYLVHVIDHTGTSEAGVTMSPLAVAPLYDMGDPLMLSHDPPTGTYGLGVYFGVTGSAIITLQVGPRDTAVTTAIFGDTLTFSSVTL
jgi:hypothetical protein